MVSPKFSGLQYAPIFGEYLLNTAIGLTKSFGLPFAAGSNPEFRAYYDEDFKRKFKRETEPVFGSGIANTQLPFGDKTLGDAAQDTLLGFNTFDAYTLPFFASGVVPRYLKTLAPTTRLGKASVGLGKAITEPISKNPNFQRRLAAELAFDTGIKFATEAGGTAFGLVSPLATNLAVRGITNTGKKIIANPPTLKDYINNPAAANVARPSRVIPVDERPTIGGASDDPNPLEFYGRDTSASTTGNSPDPSFRGDGEFQRLNFKIKLMDANEIITSNDPFSPTFAKDPRYPEIKQPRERLTTREEQLELVDLAKNLRADDLIDDTLRLDSGMPIIGSKHVESGNKRMMAIKLAKKDYPEVYDAYVTRLRERLEEFGIPRTDLDQFDLTENIPVIVRERTTVLPNDKIRSYVIDANTSNVEAFSAAEEAGQLAEGWSSDLLNRLIPVGKTIQDSLRAATNSEVVSAFLSHVKGNPNSKNWFKSGKLTEEGITKLVQGLRVRIFGQDNADFLIRNIDELPDQQTKSLFNAIDEALPQLAVIKGKIGKFTQGTDYDISDNIMGAIRRFRELKDLAVKRKKADKTAPEVKNAISNYLNQTQMFNEFASDPVELQLLRLFDGHGKGSATSKQISSVFSKYEELVEQNIGQASMFGPRTKLDILEQAIRDSAPEGTDVVTGDSGRILTTLEDDVKYQQKTVDDPNFDKDVDDPLTTKEKKQVEKVVREEGNYKDNEKVPINEIESDLNPKNTPVTRSNLNDPIINTGKEDDIPMTATSRTRHNNRTVNETVQVEPIVVEKDILDSDDAAKIIATAEFRQLIGDFSIELENSPKQKAINRIYNTLRAIGIKPETLNLKHQEKNVLQGIRTAYDKAIDIINSKTAKIVEEIDARVKRDFDVDKKTGLINGIGLIEKQVTNAQGKVVLKNGKPIIKKYRPTFSDVAADPGRFNLSPKQLTALDSINDTMIPVSQIWKQIPVIYEKYKYVDVIEQARKDINKDNGFWIPRGGAFEEGTVEQAVKSKTYNRAKAWNKTAQFDSMGEGIDNGFEYEPFKQALTTNIRQIMMQNVINMIEKAAKNLRDASGDVVFKTGDDIIEMDFPGLIKRKKDAVKNFTRLTNLEKVLVVRSEALIEPLLNEKPADVDKILDILINKKYTIKAGPNASMTKKEIQAEIKKQKAELGKINRELKNIEKRIRPSLLGFKQLSDLGYKELNDLYLDEKSADIFNEFVKDVDPSQRGAIQKLASAFNGLYVLTKSTFDNSGPGIQGLVGLVTNPRVWYAGLKANLKSFAKEEAYGNALIDFDEQALKTGRLNSNDWINYGLIQNQDVIRTVNGGEGIEGLKKAPFGIGKAIRGWDNLPFNRMFTTFGNVYRLSEADDLLAEELARGHTMQSLKDSGRLNDIAQFANRLSGTTNLGSNFRKIQDIGSIFLFAQRYYLTRLRNFQKAIQGTAMGSVLGGPRGFSKNLEAQMMAKRYQKFFLFTSTLVITINAMQGKETDLSPVVRDTTGPRKGQWRKNGNFMTIKTPWGKDYSPMGAVINVPGHVFNFTASQINAIQNKSLGKSLKGFEDSLSSIGSGIFKIPMDLITNEEWNGTPIQNKEDSASQRLADVLLYAIDAFSPFAFANFAEEIEDSVNATKKYWESERKALDLGVLVKDYGLNSGQALLEFGGVLSSDNTYLDILIQEARKRGFDYTRLEPHQKRDFKEIVEDQYKKEKEGAVRLLAKAFGRSSEPPETSLEFITQQRIDKQNLYLTYLKRGYGQERIKRYTIRDFAKDVSAADDKYYNVRQGILLESGDPFSDDNSYEETSENIIALEEYYDLNEIYYDPKLEEVDRQKYDIQDALFLGKQVKLKDGSIVGGWSRDQIEFVLRNTNDMYYEPEVLQKMLQAGRVGVYPLKYWYASRIKSEQARERFKKAGSPGTALDPNAKFFWDSRTFNLRVLPDVPDIPTDFLDRATGTNNQLPPGLRQGEGGPVPAFQFPEGSPYRRD